MIIIEMLCLISIKHKAFGVRLKTLAYIALNIFIIFVGRVLRNVRVISLQLLQLCLMLIVIIVTSLLDHISLIFV